MAQKHLHELLKEDQEPFYITNKRFHLKRLNLSSPKTSSLQIKKIQKPINQTPTSKFCKNTCFSSFNDSPELRKSPLYLSSPATKKSPENGKFVLHVPARTAALLHEAAMRIQKQQSSSKPKNQIKKVKFGVFGSILKRLKDRNGTLAETQEMPNKAVCNGPLWSRSSPKPTNSDIMHGESFSASDCTFFKDRNGTLAEMLDMAKDNRHSWSDPFSNVVHSESFSASSSHFLKDRYGKNKGEIKNGENSFCCSYNNNSNEEKSMDLETYSNIGDFGSCSLSPFRFSLPRCPSSGDAVPEFTSPAASPVCHKKEDKEKYETIGLASNDLLVVEEEEEDEKEQCSPVSVLDPPFEEEEDGHEDGDEDEEEDSDLDCSYALVQRAQQKLLYKLRRFEKLAELDPIELEKLLFEEEEEEEDSNEDPVEEEEYQVSDLISEEKFDVKSLNYGEAVVFGRECKKLDSSQELRSNKTIDMMVKWNLKSEFDDEWNEFQEQREGTAIEFAFSIFGLLVEELEEELIHLAHS